ncbi:MAG: LysR family transcriptional regulator, partial [Brevundimonas sp.]
PLTALRAFDAFARHGAMTLAARELSVTHGAVSRQIATLQASLGVDLVEGPRHRLRLTRAGRALADELAPAFAAIRRGVDAARGASPIEIEVSCLGTLAVKWLIPRLHGFMDRHPDIRVRLSESYAPVDFRRDRFDAAIRIFEQGQTAPGAEVSEIMPQMQGLVGSPAAVPPGSRWDDLAGLPRLHAATFPESWRVWSGLSGVTLGAATVEREFGHNHSLIEAAAAGLGLAIVPWAFVAPDLASGRLVAPFGFLRRTSRFVFVRPAGRTNAAVDAFRDWLAVQGEATEQPDPSSFPAAG